MSLLGTAVVAIWHDVKHEARVDYFEWHNKEHMAERAGIPGFLRGRRFGAIEGAPEFFTLYEADSLDVLTGPDYLQRLNNPTAQTRRVAAQLQGNVRSLCRIALSIGSGTGGHVMTWRYDVMPGMEERQRKLIEERLRRLIASPAIVAVHLCLADPEASAVQTAEKATRPLRALTPHWVIVVEGGSERGALEHECARALPSLELVDEGAQNVARGLYQLQFQAG